MRPVRRGFSPLALDYADYQDAKPDLVARLALDRMSQRMEVWLAAEESKSDLQNNPDNVLLRDYVVKLAKKTGFFSVWMAVFDDDNDMKSRLIDAFPGTRSSGCFDANGLSISPAPNPDGLASGSKI